MYDCNINLIMNSLPIDLIQYCIFDKLDFITQIRFRQLCKWLNRIDIHNMYFHISIKYFYRLSDKILSAYPKIIYLKTSHNEKITNVNYMTNLKILDAYCYSGISDNGIKDINLFELNASENEKITNINHMNNLQILNASGYYCGLDDNGIKNLNLIELHVRNNRKITNVNHMTKLEILDVSGYYCSIDDNGIKDLNLIELNASFNSKIKNVSYMTNLKILNTSYDCGLRLGRYAL